MPKFWLYLPLVAAAIVLALLLYTVLRWRRAPAAFRAMLWTTLGSLLAGFLLGLWAFHAFGVGGPTSSPAPAPSASPVAEARATSATTPHSSSSTPTRSPEQALYVLTGKAITEYPLTSETAAPILSIGGDHTGLTTYGLEMLAVDSAGSIYVGDYSTHTIMRFSAGASGDVPPASIISGPATSLKGPSAVVVEPSHDLLVADEGKGFTSGRILTFPEAANGNVPPSSEMNVRGVSFSLRVSMARDRTGLIWTSIPNLNRVVGISTADPGAPFKSLEGPITGLDGPDGLAFDADGRMYVANVRGNSVTVYPPNSVGSVQPVQTIFGPLTEIQTPHYLAVDAGGQIFVAGDTTVLRFASGSSGDVKPAGKIKIGGPFSGTISDIAVGPPVRSGR